MTWRHWGQSDFSIYSRYMSLERQSGGYCKYSEQRILPDCFVNTYLYSTFSELPNRMSSMSPGIQIENTNISNYKQYLLTEWAHYTPESTLRRPTSQCSEGKKWLFILRSQVIQYTNKAGSIYLCGISASKCYNRGKTSGTSYI
jgi:hypothetical protein